MNEKHRRKSYMHIGRIYFWTATIYRWQKLIETDECRDLIISCLAELISSELVDVYGYVIMPNHVHFVWKLLRSNGAEKPNVSFLKHTAHELRKCLTRPGSGIYGNFLVSEYDRVIRIWQRDSLAILLDSRHKAFQKLNYLHDNPLQDRWGLARHPAEYKYSSAGFYEKGESSVLPLKDLRDEF